MRNIILLLYLFLGFAPLSVYSDDRASSTLNQNFTDNKPPQALNKKLLSLPVNKWVKIHDTGKTDWHRQQHSGIAYNSKRGTVLLFGSDTHGNDWDNSVHEFNPFTEQWTTHYKPADKSTYRLNEEGIPIAGTDKLLPWAMHTFDNIVYNPVLDALVITGLPEHNPIKKKFTQDKKTKLIHPTWIYDLQTKTWRYIKPVPKQPDFFATSSAYDPVRDTVLAYRWGIWELANDKNQWSRATGENHHKIHHMMEYDSVNRKFAVFGDSKDTNHVWLYTPGTATGIKGKWEERIPAGDTCPEDQHFPVAFDPDNGVFVLLPDNITFKLNEKGNRRRIQGKSSSTFIYSVTTNQYMKLSDADMPPQHMNYMMVYDRYHRIFLLITGKPDKPVIVWALKLDMSRL